jgi:hypothetical protein
MIQQGTKRISTLLDRIGRRFASKEQIMVKLGMHRSPAVCSAVESCGQRSSSSDPPIQLAKRADGHNQEQNTADLPNGFLTFLALDIPIADVEVCIDP